uniref:RNase H type-1 domain-containing protein n=1 Tax=Fagus sylvatica TaxID=28930 RepID=A0A2N9GS79_FAGSY
MHKSLNKTGFNVASTRFDQLAMREPLNEHREHEHEYQSQYIHASTCAGPTGEEYLSVGAPEEGHVHHGHVGMVVVHVVHFRSRRVIHRGHARNEAKYEALLTGLRIAKVLGATTLRVQSDSQLIVGQVNGEYEAKKDRMAKYLSLVKNIMPSSEEAINQQIEVQYSPSHTEEEMNPINVNDSWMTPITKYLEEGTLLADPVEARKLKKSMRGSCGNHSRARSLVHKLVRAGYYWPTMQKDAISYTALAISARDSGNLIYSPPETLTPMTAPWPFAQWGLDIIRPFPVGRRQLKFLVVGIDYFTKVFISDNGRQFDNSPFREFCEELGIHNHYSSPAVIPIEIGLTNWRTNHHDESNNNSQLRMNLDLLDEAHDQAEAKTRTYQQRMARYHDRRVKHREFKIGDLVLRKVTLATKDPTQGKLGPTWEGPYRVIKFFRRGTYHLEKLDGTALPHPWNAEHLKKYYQ